MGCHTTTGQKCGAISSSCPGAESCPSGTWIVKLLNVLMEKNFKGNGILAQVETKKGSKGKEFRYGVVPVERTKEDLPYLSGTGSGELGEKALRGSSKKKTKIERW